MKLMNQQKQATLRRKQPYSKSQEAAYKFKISGRFINSKAGNAQKQAADLDQKLATLRSKQPINSKSWCTSSEASSLFKSWANVLEASSRSIQKLATLSKQLIQKLQRSAVTNYNQNV